MLQYLDQEWYLGSLGHQTVHTVRQLCCRYAVMEVVVRSFTYLHLRVPYCSIDL